MPLQPLKKLVYRHTRALRFRLRLQRQWKHFRAAMDGGEPLAVVRADLRALVEAPPTVIGSKGQPDMAGLKRERARAILDALEGLDGQPDRIEAATLATARELAALETSDNVPQRIHLALFCVAHAPLLQALDRSLSRHVVAHISCRARLERAAASCASFEPLVARGELSQLTVVGGGFGERYEFDPERQLLTVPASDAYEHLPSKVAAAWFLLGLVEKVEGVLKVDDDHRLQDGARLLRTFGSLGDGPALQLGHLYFADYLGAHNRAWHMGKSSDPAVNAAPYGYPGARQWATGHTGYFLNRPALRLAGWAYTHFREHFRTGIYEDIVLSDLIERLGGRLRHAEMTDLLGADARY